MRGSSLPSAYRRPSTVIAEVVRNTAAVWRDKDHDRLSNQDKWDLHLMFIPQRQLCIKIAILILTSSFLTIWLIYFSRVQEDSALLTTQSYRSLVKSFLVNFSDFLMPASCRK